MAIADSHDLLWRGLKTGQPPLARQLKGSQHGGTTGRETQTADRQNLRAASDGQQFSHLPGNLSAELPACQQDGQCPCFR